MITSEERMVFNRLWVELRCYLNNEILRRYIVMRKVLGSKVLLAEEQGAVEELFETKSPLNILKSLFKNALGSHLFPLSERELVNEIRKCVVNNQSAYGEVINLMVNRVVFDEGFNVSEFWEKIRETKSL